MINLRLSELITANYHKSSANTFSACRSSTSLISIDATGRHYDKLKQLFKSTEHAQMMSSIVCEEDQISQINYGKSCTYNCFLVHPVGYCHQ